MVAPVVAKPPRFLIVSALQGQARRAVPGLDFAAALFLAQGLDILEHLRYYGRARLFVGRVALRRVSGVRGQQEASHLGGWGASFFGLGRALYMAFLANHPDSSGPGGPWRAADFPRLSIPKM